MGLVDSIAKGHLQHASATYCLVLANPGRPDRKATKQFCLYYMCAFQSWRQVRYTKATNETDLCDSPATVEMCSMTSIPNSLASLRRSSEAFCWSSVEQLPASTTNSREYSRREDIKPTTHPWTPDANYMSINQMLSCHDRTVHSKFPLQDRHTQTSNTKACATETALYM